MAFTQHLNGVTCSFKLFFLTFSLRKIYQLVEGKKYRTFLFQFNRFENGYIDIYFRFFYKYSLIIKGIRVRQGKRFFLGNHEYKF